MNFFTIPFSKEEDKIIDNFSYRGVSLYKDYITDNFINYTYSITYKKVSDIFNSIKSPNYKLDFTDALIKVKYILNNSDIKIFNYIYYINTKHKLLEEEKAILIRLVNMVFKNKYFIIINDELIYIPNDYKVYFCKNYELVNYLFSCIYKYKKKEKINEKINKLITKSKSILSFSN